MDLINKYLKEQTPGYEYEYNYEGDMAKTQLNMMIDASMELKSMLANDTNLPEWVQSKITKAADYIDSARDYMKNMNKDSNGPMGEDVERKDTGWQKAQTDRKDQYGNRIKNVARQLARQGMQSAVKDLKKGPEAGKRQVEEVELDEEEGFSPSGHRKLATHHFNKAKELYQKADSTGDSYGADHLNDIAGKHATAYRAHKEASTDPTKSAEAHKASREANDMIESVDTEEVELDELKEPTVQKYITRAKFSTIPKRRAMAQKAQAKLQQKQNPMKTEESELEEAESKLYNKLFDKYADSFTKKGKTTPEKQAMYKKMAQNAYKMLPGKSAKPNLPEEVEELEELKPPTLASYTGKAADQMANAAIDKSTGAAMGTMGRMSNMPDLAKKGSDKEDKAFQTILKRTKGITSASRRLAKEEAELGEELSSSQRDTHFSLMNKHGVLAKSAKGANKDAHRMAALDHQMALRNPENSQSRSKALSLSNKLGVKEDVELDESLTKKLAAMGVAATMAASPMAQARVTPGGQSAAQQMSQNVSPSQLPSKETKSSAGFSKEYLKKVASGEHPRPLISKDHANELLKKHYSEEVDLVSKYSKLGEAKFPGFRVRMTSGGPKLPRRSYVPQGDEDPRTGMPLGFSPPKDEPKKPQLTKTKQS